MRNNESVAQQLQAVQERMRTAAQAAKREASAITLIGAAKEKSAALVKQFGDAGLNSLGENYVQQGIEKQASLQNNDFTWHFIGKIQSNKTKDIAGHFSWVHTIDRIKIASRFDQHRNSSIPLNVLVQVDIDKETNKGGVQAEQCAEFCERVSQFPNLCLRGLMVLPKPRTGFEKQRKPFALSRELLESANQRYGLEMDTLSMGMSNDLEAAIFEGSTMVRIGTDLFGAR